MDFRKYENIQPYSGITSNPAECVNNIIKSLQKRKELPVDMISLTLYFLQRYIFTEIQCGRAGFGNYKLKQINMVVLAFSNLYLVICRSSLLAIIANMYSGISTIGIFYYENH